MQVIIKDGGRTMILESTSSLGSSRAKRIIDILMDTPAPQKLEIPVDPVKFSSWLNEDSHHVRVIQLNEYVGFDLRTCKSMHKVVCDAPQVATLLGLGRYIRTCRWLHRHGWLSYLPSEVSLRTYYQKAVRG